MSFKDHILSSFIALENEVDTNSYVHNLRSEAINEFEKLGIPQRKEETYKYTSLKSVFNKEYSLFPKKESIFMLGDSPATDISGANQQGWTSILIQTGNHHYGLDKPNCQADFTFANLESFDKNFFN